MFFAKVFGKIFENVSQNTKGNATVTQKLRTNFRELKHFIAEKLSVEDGAIGVVYMLVRAV